ncbi:MAG: MBL fold metallo-hydrolase [Patescibacteria group bacterium]|nr:MBL fold metallo-hydrolase [Patescibacteria group bacterium]
MEIRHIGHSCFEIKNKNITIVTDPFTDDYGIKMPKLKANIVTVSHEHRDHNNVEAIASANSEKDLFVVRNSGGYEIEGVLIEGISTFHDDKNGAIRGINNVYDIKMDGITLCHMGDLGADLSEEQIEELDGIDVLFVPVGGKYTVDAEHAAKIVNKIEPRIVIPMHYAVPGMRLELDSVDKFVKEIGLAAEKLDVLKVEKKDLPQEGMRLVILG